MNAKWQRKEEGRENTNTPHVFLQILFFSQFPQKEKKRIAVKGKEIEKHKLHSFSLLYC
jgi:hypothetical protein